jgi:hypothetical protein
MRCIPSHFRPAFNSKIIVSLCSVLSLPVCAESFENDYETRNSQPARPYLLAAGPSYLGLPRPPAPPLPRAPRVPRYDGQKVFRQGPSFYGGWSTGGDTLRTDGGSKLHAGDGTSVHIGWNADFKTGSARTALQWAIGYRWKEASFTDSLGRSGTAKMSVIPLDTLAYFQQGHFRVGGGLTYHLFPHYTEEVKGSLFDTTNTVDFNSQLGLIAAMEFVGIDAPFFLNFRFTYIVYKPEGGSYVDSQTNETVSEVNGSNFSIHAGFHFR